MSKFQTNDGRVHVAEPAHVNAGTPVPTQAVADEWASASDVISAHPAQLGAFAQSIASKSLVMNYTKAAGDNNASLPESMYSHHWNGSTLVRKQNNAYHPPVAIMQPDSAWAQHDRDALLLMKKQYPFYEAVFNDTSRAAYDIGGAPVVPGTHTTDTRASWNAKLKAKMDLCNDALGYAYRCLNGLSTADTMTQFTPCIGMIEAAFGPLDHSLPTPAQWKHDADTIWQSQGYGWTPWVYVKMNTAHGSPEWDAFRALTLTTTMLLDRGSVLYCIGGKEGTPAAWQTGEYKHPWYAPGIGAPADPAPANYSAYLDQASGAYVKYYTQGAVIVNPATAPAAVSLRGITVQVAAQSGKIMRASTQTTTTWTAV